MDDVDPRISKHVLAHAAAGAGLNLLVSARTRGVRRAAHFFALGVCLPAAGELFAIRGLGLLRHRTQPRIKGVPLAILLSWYNVIHGSYAVAERVLDRLPLNEEVRRTLLPPGAALVATSLDLILDPFCLDGGLWVWNASGAYAREISANGRRGVPLLNYVAWMMLGAGASLACRRLTGDRISGRGPALLLLPYYLAAVAWAVRRRRLRYLLYSGLFPAALYASLKRE
jgi:uncharacterized membrane protein